MISHYKDPYERTRIQWRVGGFFWSSWIGDKDHENLINNWVSHFQDQWFHMIDIMYMCHVDVHLDGWLIGLFQLGSNHWKIRALLRKAAAVNGTEDHDRQRRSVTARKLRGFSTWAVDYTIGKTRFSRKNGIVPGVSSRFYIHLLKCGSKEPVKPTHSDRAREQAEASC